MRAAKQFRRIGVMPLVVVLGAAVLVAQLIQVVPAAAATYGPQVTVPFSGLGDPMGVAVDSAGDVYATNGTQVFKLTPGGTQTTLPFSGLDASLGVAVDSAGDVYATNEKSFQSYNVLELTPGGAQTALPFGGLCGPEGVALDASGDVFVTDDCAGVVELSPSGVQTTLAFSGLCDPEGVALDASGDVFVTDDCAGVVELSPSGVQTTLAFSGLDAPAGVALDSARDVYVADLGNADVVELTPGGAQTTVPFSGLNSPNGVAVDSAGDVYVGDTGNLDVVELPVAAAVQNLKVTVSGSQTWGSSTPVFATTTSPPAGDSFSGTLRCTTVGNPPQTISSSLPAGRYTINGSSCSGLTLTGPTAADYQIVYTGGTFTVNRAATTLVATPEGTIFSQLQATLTRTFDRAPLAGRTISFAVAGTTVCTATTNTSGVATCKVSGVSFGGSYTASYAGDANTLDSSGSAKL